MAVYNAANEEAVDAFHDGRIGFGQIVDTVAAVVAEHDGAPELTVQAVLAAEKWARVRAHERLGMM
jgi:1-deoxy-D-xylulose-5-phosphate reductoisomerase